MKAVVWHGTHDVRTEDVPDPRIVRPKDAIVKVAVTTICGSDLHIYDGFIPSMRPGDVIGHEVVGEVVEVGPDVRHVRKGDRVLVISIIGCGCCFHCKRTEFSLCDNSNPHAAMQEKLFGYATAGIFGYSHLFGGYAGGQAEAIRVPFADVNCVKVPDGVTDEQALAITDAFPTGYMGADIAGIEPGDVVAVWGAGPVGQFAIKSAALLGAEKVVAIDRFPERLERARKVSGAIPLNYAEADVLEELKEITAGRGPDRCIDAVGMEAHGLGPAAAYDNAKVRLGFETGRANVLREMIRACRKGGVCSIMGVYAGVIDKFPMGVAMNKALTFRMGQMHGQRYAPELLRLTREGKVDPGFVYTHHFALEDAPEAYKAFRDKQDGCLKTILHPPGAKRNNRALATEAEFTSAVAAW